MEEKILMKTRFGSHLYGTDTPNSDTDYKAVYQAALSDVILNRAKETIYKNSKPNKDPGVRNTKEDSDFELIELRKFIKDALAGQTYALDLLFTPIDFVDYFGETWLYVVENRSKLLSKHMEPYIGYCRTQAAKYGLKGSRLGDVMRIVDYLKQFDSHKLLSEVMDGFEQTEFIKLIDHQVRKNGQLVTEKWWTIVGKKFAQNTKISYIIESEENFMEKYGERARLAQKNEGIDWKAVSHAYRVMLQLEEIATTGSLVFPLKQAADIKKIKAGQVSYSQMLEDLPKLMEVATREVEESKFLSTEPDYKFWDEFLIRTYTP